MVILILEANSDDLMSSRNFNYSEKHFQDGKILKRIKELAFRMKKC